MPVAALGLVLISALLHAAWNALTKNTSQRLSLLWLAMLAGSVLALFAAVALGAEIHLPTQVRGLLMVSSLVHAGYFFALSRAYQADLSLAYPLARGLAVGLAPLGAWFWLNERPSAWGAIGILCVVAGGLWVGLSGRRASPTQGAANQSGMRWALFGGCLVATYSLVDARGARLLHPAVYVAWMGLGSSLVLLPLMLTRRPQLSVLLMHKKRLVIAVAAMSLGAYGLVLSAFRISSAGYVIACRELSIVASVLLGRLWLKEAHWRLRFIGALVIIVGAAIITVFG